MPDDLSPTNFYLLRNRINKGLSQQRLADMLGTTQQNVARWENGKTIPGPYYRQKLCDLFAEIGRASCRERV